MTDILPGSERPTSLVIGVHAKVARDGQIGIKTQARMQSDRARMRTHTDREARSGSCYLIDY